jgi:RsiW-degrading membrane proteinase PrsW (M82 family)
LLLLKSFSSGIISAVFYTLISLFFLNFSTGKISHSGNLFFIITSTTEELFKIIFIVYWVNKNKSIKLSQLFIVCASVGLGFSLIENIFYSALFYAGIDAGFVIIRSTLVPFIHITATSIFGFFIYKGKKELFAYNFILGLLLSSLIHYYWNILT